MKSTRRKQLAILWGSSGAYGVDRFGERTAYWDALELIEQGAALHGYEPHLILYPGHPSKRGSTKGKLSFCSALLKILGDFRELRPEWIIGRSLGALLAPAALSCGNDWAKMCKGAVMWGPGFKRYMDTEWPNDQKKAEAVKQYRKYRTSLVSDYFDTLPTVETLVRTARCNLRLARGTKDRYNSNSDLRRLKVLHARNQPAFKRHIVVLPGFDHTPTRKMLSNDQLKSYFECLFGGSFERDIWA